MLKRGTPAPQAVSGLAHGIPVDLPDAATGLDDRNIQRLVTAILHASGKRPSPADIDDHL